MLRCKIISDIHIEFGFDYKLIKRVDEDAIILAGDVGVGSKMTYECLSYFSKEFPHVLYVFGNHEFYNKDIDKVIPEVKGYLKDTPNVHILDRESVCIDGVTFVGATLWSNFKERDPFVMRDCSRAINDFRLITKGGKSFSTTVMADVFDKDWGYIKTVVKQTPAPVVVVTHFLPSHQCVHPKYRGEALVNHYFASELGNDIVDMPNVPYWIFGHTHDFIDETIGTTRCIANPYGYHNRERRIVSGNDPLLNFNILVNTD